LIGWICLVGLWFDGLGWLCKVSGGWAHWCSAAFVFSPSTQLWRSAECLGEQIDDSAWLGCHILGLAIWHGWLIGLVGLDWFG
jgi:hypothetical protein